ncbi:bifunctional NUDIX hydrolase/histidine phosphatase family protein [Geodermatophilus ruber]|uniref:8-oxo-dGTP diphosphatase n=1 Tax=Geodermatophilus ruber TaxID=504800 RepID=A0A1I4I4F1_9ACTN|nr:NUDIX hydrolase [Geodermatophilus ruber]SFL48853.1 8-oxo-dGTP diphosphatase [Geodermatophilus ruber]
MSTEADTGLVVRAAGGALWRPADDGTVETAVVHRPRYDDWSLPKGKLDAGEHALTAAVREVTEETGLGVVAGRRSLRTEYALPVGAKRVDYWLMRVVGGEFVANQEVDRLRWLPLPEAAALVTHEADRAVLADLGRTDVPRAPTLLLVRHGRAGDKSRWEGHDDLRPLDSKGRRQARRLAEVLPLFGPTEVFTVPRTRCRQTVEPLAERLGLPVQDLPELGEQEFAADPQAGLAVVNRLLSPRGTPGVSVVCSQGGAIPSVLLSLGVGRPGVAARLHPPAAKGSVWALGGRPGELAADYYRDFEADPDAPESAPGSAPVQAGRTGSAFGSQG